MFGFEKLEVWQKSIDFSERVYQITQNFPLDERFGLTNQMRRASVSLSSNIAEGSSRASGKDFSRFIGIAYSSAMEVVSQMYLSRRQKFLSESEFKDLYQRADQLARMLSGLKTSVPNLKP